MSLLLCGWDDGPSLLFSSDLPSARPQGALGTCLEVGPLSACPLLCPPPQGFTSPSPALRGSAHTEPATFPTPCRV